MVAKPRVPKIFKPSDYLRGSQATGKNYTAFNTYGQGKPDFGKGAGPGEPYHEVVKPNLGKNILDKDGQKVPPWKPPTTVSKKPPWASSSTRPLDARTQIIRRRLGWTK